ncbi:uncharacterized protein TRIREDRAFT_109972 [Trichoderma reesei QM6a]|uniref:Predicted protein n=2 Tax=Hypocrea jecorina TaxID=51453 RepID=G0RQW1_HYPJQ|nr:uncharacterized protein TRIREDRAFT_109972 [Trichoderma reesei QM6a]EGR46418.1 predicted protein [Trichoderma reesei QM6a]
MSSSRSNLGLGTNITIHTYSTQNHISIRDTRQIAAMAELVYHNGHYHHVSHRGDRHRPRRNDDWSLIKFWDEVLYNIGDLYYKVRRR